MSGKRPFALIAAAAAENLGIGYRNAIPWNIKKDYQFFRDKTSKTVDPAKRNAVIMGRLTFESAELKARPLPKRLNIILSRNRDYLR